MTGGSASGGTTTGGSGGTSSAGAAGSGTSGSAGSGSGGTSPNGGNGGAAAGGTGGSAAGEAGAPAGGTSGGAGAPSGLVPAFMALGHLGRTTVSCDDGRTWIRDRSQDETSECWGDNNEPDCDHSEYAGRGLVYAMGGFVASWGWGTPGTLTRSTNGIDWTEVGTDTPTFAGIAFGKGTLVANSSPTWLSTDGVEWDEGGSSMLGALYRGIGFVDYDGGRFIAVGQDGSTLGISHSRDGRTFTRAASTDGCGASFKGIAGANGHAVFASGGGNVCWSDDGGANWTMVDLTSELDAGPIFTGTEFLVWSRGRVHWSADGKTWTNEALSSSNLRFGAVARSPEGTFVAVNGEWQEWYGSQHFYRSSDGKTWETLPATAFKGGHPITFMTFGYVEAGNGCVAR